MSQIDKRGRLTAEPFAYHMTKNGKVFIEYEGRTVTTLQGKPAQKFLQRIATVSSQGAQLIMAKLTGNFKRGNERQGKNAQN